MDFGEPLRGERVRLGLRTLYIVPTRFGWLWLAGAGLLQVVGIQLQRNGPLLLSFLMLALLLLALHLTHFNLMGLELRCGQPAPGFADEPLAYPLLLRCPSRCEGLDLRFGDGPMLRPGALMAGEHGLSVPWRASGRGRQRPGRLRIRTTAPLGLFVCWTRWDPPSVQLVWPARVAGPVAQVGRQSLGAEAAALAATPGNADWHDLEPHRPEDGQGRLAWKLLAAGRGRHTKTFRSDAEPAPLLTVAAAVPLEQALEHLSERIWRCQREGQAYGLVAGGRVLAEGRGMGHRDRCLEALALWQ